MDASTRLFTSIRFESFPSPPTNFGRQNSQPARYLQPQSLRPPRLTYSTNTPPTPLPSPDVINISFSKFDISEGGDRILLKGKLVPVTVTHQDTRSHLSSSLQSSPPHFIMPTSVKKLPTLSRHRSTAPDGRVIVHDAVEMLAYTRQIDNLNIFLNLVGKVRATRSYKRRCSFFKLNLTRLASLA